MKKKYFATKQAARKAKNERIKKGERGLQVFKMLREQDIAENLPYALK